MSFWDERVVEHQVVDDIRVTKSKIEEIDTATDTKDPIVLDAKARLLAVIDHLQKRLAMVDPYFVPLQVLDDISRSLNIAVQCLDKYKTKPEVGHLTLANVAADNILGQLSLLWFPRSAEEVEDLRLAAVSLRRTLDEHSRVLRAQLNEISADSSRLSAELSELKKQVSQQRSLMDAADSKYDA